MNQTGGEVMRLRWPDVQDAQQFLRRYLAPTRLLGAPSLERGNAEVYLKLESEMPTGSFKVRGALYAPHAEKQEGRPRKSFIAIEHLLVAEHVVVEPARAASLANFTTSLGGPIVLLATGSNIAEPILLQALMSGKETACQAMLL